MKASDKACLPLVQCLVECGASIEVTDNVKNDIYMHRFAGYF